MLRPPLLTNIINDHRTIQCILNRYHEWLQMTSKQLLHVNLFEQVGIAKARIGHDSPCRVLPPSAFCNDHEIVFFQKTFQLFVLSGVLYPWAPSRIPPSPTHRLGNDLTEVPNQSVFLLLELCICVRLKRTKTWVMSTPHDVVLEPWYCCTTSSPKKWCQIIAMICSIWLEMIWLEMTPPLALLTPPIECLQGSCWNCYYLQQRITFYGILHVVWNVSV